MRLSICVKRFLAVCLLLIMVPANAITAAPQTIMFPQTGFAVSDTAQVRFLSEFNRLGGVNSLGYPLSQPFEMQGFTYQIFQRTVLQWQPNANQAFAANIMDWLSDAGKDTYLASLGIPPHDSGTPGVLLSQAAVEREAWLTDESIAELYHNAGGMDRFGLPTSRPQRSGPFVVQRFQRFVFQHWIEDVPGMPPKGSVVGALVGNFLIQSGILPKEATAPIEPGSAPSAVPINVPANAHSGRVTAVGDSVMLAAASDLEAVAGDIDIDAVVGRQVSAAIDVLRARHSAGQLGSTVVIHIGNNGTFTTGQFDEMMGLLSNVRRVVFVDVKVPRQWEGSNNAVIADGVRRYSNTVLVDWHSASASRPELFWDDGVHLRPAGVKAYVNLIAPYLLAP